MHYRVGSTGVGKPITPSRGWGTYLVPLPDWRYGDWRRRWREWWRQHRRRPARKSRSTLNPRSGKQ